MCGVEYLVESGNYVTAHHRPDIPIIMVRYSLSQKCRRKKYLLFNCRTRGELTEWSVITINLHDFMIRK